MGTISICPVCDCLHDDGAFIFTPDDSFVYVCMDCSDNYTDEQILKIISKKFGNN